MQTCDWQCLAVQDNDENRYAWADEDLVQANRKTFSFSRRQKFFESATGSFGRTANLFFLQVSFVFAGIEACTSWETCYPCEARGFDHRSVDKSGRSVGDLRSTSRKFWKKLDAASRFESFFSLSLERERSADETANWCRYTWASVFDRSQKFGESAARLDGLAKLSSRSNGVEGQIEPEIKRCGPIRVRCWSINASVTWDPRQNKKTNTILFILYSCSAKKIISGAWHTLASLVTRKW